MKYTPRILARALLLAVRDKTDDEAKRAVKVFVALMVARGCAPLLPAALRLLPLLATGAAGEVEIVSSRPLSARTIALIRETVGADRSVGVKARVEAGQVAGVRIKRADRVIDATLRSRLDLFRRIFRR